MTINQEKTYNNIINSYLEKKNYLKAVSIAEEEKQKALDITWNKNKSKKRKNGDQANEKNDNKKQGDGLGIINLLDEDGNGKNGRFSVVTPVIDLSSSPAVLSSSSSSVSAKHAFDDDSSIMIISDNSNASNDEKESENTSLINEGIIKQGMTSSEAKSLFTTLRKAANHPLLLRIHYTNKKQLEKIAKVAYQEEYFGTQCSLQQVMNEIENNFSDYDIHSLCLQFPAYLENDILNETTLFQSPKMIYLQSLIPQLKMEGHRILLFSQWTRLLDLLEILLNTMDISFLRLDGSTAIKERQELIDLYNEDDTITVFLLSTKAGGLGINLTSADTVILHDLDFNPENDKQAEVISLFFIVFLFLLSFLFSFLFLFLSLFVGSLSSYWSNKTCNNLQISNRRYS
jgi:hypothetical protein